VKLRIEALMSAAAYDDPKAVVIADFSGPAATEWTASTAAGVTLSLGDTNVGDGITFRSLVATNAGTVPRNASWARLGRRFESPLNLGEQQALGLWIEGDGQGELLAVRLESPRHIAFGAVADRYLDVNFTGRRFFTLVETESARWNDYVWNDGKWLYNVYRETIDFGAVESVSVGYQNVAPGKEVKCRLGPIKALPMRSATMKNPAVTLNGETVVFPIEMVAGCWIEFDGLDNCILYGPKGELIRKLTPLGSAPALTAGDNAVRFSCATVPGPSPRARLTVRCHGEAL
jgi:hypothetical protein